MSETRTKPGCYKWDRRFLRLAKEVSTWSRDPSTQVGAVAISPEGRIISTGYNGLPRGIDDTDFRLNDRETKYGLTIHAEHNCVLNANYHGVSLRNSTVYVSSLPCCSQCALVLVQVGVSRVVMDADAYRSCTDKWKDSFKTTAALFDEAGVQYQFIENEENQNNESQGTA